MPLHVAIIALLFFTGSVIHEIEAQYYSYYYPSYSYYPYYYGAYSYYPYYGYYYYGKREVDWNQAPQSFNQP
uniref:Uncharacterized protein n=1 Tax=Heterorhabditis bacteriophora TaxID=37862 RepID=A0A1I7XKX9_HETBA